MEAFVGTLQRSTLEGFGFGQLACAHKYLAGDLAGLAFRIFIDVFPVGWTVRPDHQPKPLQQSVTTATVSVCPAHIVGNSARLRVA